MTARMRSLAFFALCTVLSATEMERGLFRGTLEAVEGTASQGILTARAANGNLATCAYDGRSYIEREKERATALRLDLGETIEVVADHRPGTRTCYARTVHVIPPAPASPRRAQQVARRRQVLLLQGDRTIAGLVTHLEGREVTLRTRDGEVTLVLRPDTRYLGDGPLSVNRRVSVSAGRSLSGQLEAYQVTWGEILAVP